MKEAIKIEKIFLLRHMKFNFFLLQSNDVLKIQHGRKIELKERNLMFTLGKHHKFITFFRFSSFYFFFLCHPHGMNYVREWAENFVVFFWFSGFFYFSAVRNKNCSFRDEMEIFLVGLVVQTKVN